MMGLGFLTNGGSSSSSNLSALAPPFTVDRFHAKPNSNPPVHFTEPLLPYAVPFDSSLHNWQYSHPSASRPDFFSNPNSEVDSIKMTCFPSANNYQCSGSQAANSSDTNRPHINLSAKNATDEFGYFQYSGDTPASLAESKLYYPPYVSPAVDHDTPSVIFKDLNYDLLSTPHDGHLDVPAQVNYSHSLSGLEYTPQWGGFWNQMVDMEQGKQIEVQGSFCSKEIKVAGSHVYANYMKQVAPRAESLSECGEGYTISHRGSIDVLGRENLSGSLSTELLDNKSFPAQNLEFNAIDSSRTSMFGTSPELPGPQSLATWAVATTNSWNSQKYYDPSYEKGFHMLDTCMDDCKSGAKSSPAVVIRPPVIDTNSAPKIIPFQVGNLNGNVAAVNATEFDGHNTLKRKEARLASNSKFKGRCLDVSQPPSVHLGRTDFIFDASSSTKEGELPNRLVNDDVSKDTFKVRSEFQLPDINAPDSSNVAVSSAKVVGSVENSSEGLDHHNPAVDSPCWKGAPSSHFSPFDVSEAATSQNLMKAQVSNSLNLQGAHILFPYDDDPIKVSYQELDENNVYHENECLENGYPLLPNNSSNSILDAKEHKSDSAVQAGLDCLKSSSNIGVQSSSDIDKPRKESGLPKDSKYDSDFILSNTKQGLKMKLESSVGVADIKMDTNDGSEDGCVPFYPLESFSCSTSEEDTTKLAKMHERESVPKMNVQVLVDAIHNLSELLLFHCSKDACALNVRDHGALENVIKNLDACISKKTGNMTPSKESIFPHQGISNKFGELPDLHEEEKSNGNAFEKKVSKSPDFISTRDDEGIGRDDTVVQAIKKVLNQNFHVKEEMQPDTLLFKDLWLEAEAALCSVNYRARFDHMKLELEKCKSLEGKGVSENIRPRGKPPSSSISSDYNTTDKSTSRTKDDQITGSFQDSPIATITKDDDNVEASVLARLHILKCREDTVTLEKPPSTSISSNSNISGKLVPGAKDTQIPDASFQDSAIATTIKHVDDVEASVLARLHLLKCHGDIPNCLDMKVQQKSEVLLPGAKIVRIPGTSFQDSAIATPTSTPTDHVDDVEASVLARLNLLRCRGDNPNYLGMKAQHGSKVLIPGAKDVRIPETSFQDSAIAAPTDHVDDVEASVLARLHLLKGRDDNPNDLGMKPQQGSKVVGVGLNRKDGLSDMATDSYLQHHTDIGDDTELFGPFVDSSNHGVCVADVPEIQSRRNNRRLGNQLPSIWNDSSSSDWEHVLKDEFQWQK